MNKKLSDQENQFSNSIADELIEFWKFHRRFDANIKDLADYVQVSRDTIYRWLNRKALPKFEKALLVKKWLGQRKG